jgi:hypothetical protein
MRHSGNTAVASALLLALVIDGAHASEWTTFTSDAISPAPLTYTTADWDTYTSDAAVAFRHYRFEYPKQWIFTGYSVFTVASGSKVAEIAPGVVALSSKQTCFDNAQLTEDRAVRKAFRLGRAKGVVVTSDVLFHDVQKPIRVHSYCIEEGRYAFRITFLEGRGRTQSASVFRRVVSSFRFVASATEEK